MPLELSDADQAAIDALRDAKGQRISAGAARIGYLAGLRAGVERSAKACESFGLAHTYASENADHYRGFDAGTEACAKRIRALAD